MTRTVSTSTRALLLLAVASLATLSTANPLTSLFSPPSSLTTSSSTFDVFGHGPHHHNDTPSDGPHKVYDGFPRLANTLGWMSLMAWILVYSDPIILCFKQKSGEGLSIIFLIIWLVGDLTNLLGSLWQGLIPTVIILAIYYTACDCILIFQKYYYRHLRRTHPELYERLSTSGTSTPTPRAQDAENTPLLSAFSAHSPSEKALSPSLQRAKDLLEYTIGFVLVVGVGIVAWFAGKGLGKEGRIPEVWETKAQIVGWISAFLYLGSRLPQLALNRKTKCEGLSLLMFCFAVIGNVTYVASILLTSMSLQHIMINAPWLLGSAGTVFLDFLVLGQFAYYAKERRLEAEKQREARMFVDEEEEERRRREVLGEDQDQA
ncbi:PQ-loop repeat-containing protein [Sporobolomyces salmoneus]|uniref:PQ-loop repeat-containing protein n=1 Tax=Sporobolomyces salmoneus TaxID=183962 RepID=UPI0031816298